ncbi:MAG: flagellar biosynthesis protein [Planctomycetota bacterium]|jgi:flagellar biosynthesis protein
MSETSHTRKDSRGPLPAGFAHGANPQPIVLKAARRAVALRYSQEKDGAPRVVAQGIGDVAERILEAAKENNVPVREDGDLLELLSICDTGEEIPAELYSSVAELLSYLWRLNEELRPACDGKG